MPLNERLERYLRHQNVDYMILPHREVFTAQEVAQSSHVAGRLMAKVVVVREAEGSYYMTIVSAPDHVDLATIHRMTGRAKGRLATEDELMTLFPDCEVGAMPPFGKLYALPVYLDDTFRGHEEVYFQAGNHHEVVKMRFTDFEKVAGPFTGEFSLHRELAKIDG